MIKPPGASAKLTGVQPVKAGAFTAPGPANLGPRALLGSFHEGGDVTKDGAYLLEEGEHVTPAAGKRDSKYRKVYLERRSGKK